MGKKAIQVTEPFLPPIEEYVEYLKGIWDRKWLTNQGPLVRDFEQKLQEYHHLSTPVHCVANGGLGLQVILKALGVKGEVITTPFSYAATASCPLWEGCRIKYADIETDSLTIDPAAVEASITSDTEAILGTHVFGNPCDCEALESIASKHGIALVYDAAHAFGVEYKGKSILEYGDASMVSLHATKLMHSVEGGFIVAKDPVVSGKMEWMRRFGHNGYEDFHGVGINAKLSEFHAAMGLCNMKHIDEINESRKVICEAYDAHLGIRKPNNNVSAALSYRNGASRNYSYYPVLFRSEELLLAALKELNENSIYPRRYFFPNLNAIFPACDKKWTCTVADDISRRVLSLPLAQVTDASIVDAIATLLSKY